MFLSEILTNSIKEIEKNKKLFEYIELSLNWLDLNENVSNFHLFFLINLTRFLGFYPNISKLNNSEFYLFKGDSNYSDDENIVSKNNFYLFKNLLGINFDNIGKTSFDKKERQAFLNIILQYFELHLSGFKKPKSLKVLETVFS